MNSNSPDYPEPEKKVRHILALSGGKDSSALAMYLRDRVENMEYVFCDTEKELSETYDYLSKLEIHLGKKIHYLKYADGYGFDSILKIKNGFLPSAQARWCTEYLKLRPYEDYLGDHHVISYVDIRADEPHRTGYISTKPNVKTILPFVEDNIRIEDVERILNESGIGIPQYYKWRSRSGCYFCFYQQKREWIGLLHNHPDLFKKAKEYEKFNPETGERYTWCQSESLDEIAAREDSIMAEYEKRKRREATAFKGHQKLKDIWGEEAEAGESLACNICHL